MDIITKVFVKVFARDECELTEKMKMRRLVWKGIEVEFREEIPKKILSNNKVRMVRHSSLPFSLSTPKRQRGPVLNYFVLVINDYRNFCFDTVMSETKISISFEHSFNRTPTHYPSCSTFLTYEGQFEPVL